MNCFPFLKIFLVEKELFEKKMKEMEEKRDENDSGIGSRNESAELYEADADRSGLMKLIVKIPS